MGYFLLSLSIIILLYLILKLKLRREVIVSISIMLVVQPLTIISILFPQIIQESGAVNILAHHVCLMLGYLILWSLINLRKEQIQKQVGKQMNMIFIL